MKVPKNGRKKVGKMRTPPYKELPDWSEAKFFGFIRSGLRAKFSRWPPKYEVLTLASRPYKGENKRQKKEYQCSECNLWWVKTSVEVDHIVPCGSLRTFDDLPSFVARMFVGVDKLRVVCKDCHKAITAKGKT